MNQIHLHTHDRKMLADTLTPVSIYLRLRDKYQGCILLESSDYHGQDNSYSYICCNPIAHFKLQNQQLNLQLPGKQSQTIDAREIDVIEEFEKFRSAFSTKQHNFKFSTGGLFGYMSYDSIQYFEDIEVTNSNKLIPDIYYRVYQYVIVIDHFKNELYAFDHSLGGDDTLDKLISHINRNDNPLYNFNLTGGEQTGITDDEYLQNVRDGIKHCELGDVFQVVLSRRFRQSFKGDEFNVYRALRSVNPSPYLFYFDYGSFKLFGSSPESQIVISDKKASIYPIAGTFKRTGDDARDAELATKLSNDEKENAEHIMLVDLARNDLSRSADQVEVEVFKEVQYYSHVLHLVSKVTARLAQETSSIKLVADTFPAGTLSGAPKYRAMQLIDQYETESRNFYAGAIGFVGFNGDFNHAIMIRSFLSNNNELHFQAGAGITAKSNPQSELEEVGNKLAALRSALKMAEKL